MTDGGRSDEQFLRGSLEALKLGRDLEGLEKLERRQAHIFQPTLKLTGARLPFGPRTVQSDYNTPYAAATFVPGTEAPQNDAVDRRSPLGCHVREREHAGTHESSARNAAL